MINHIMLVLQCLNFRLTYSYLSQLPPGPLLSAEVACLGNVHS